MPGTRPGMTEQNAVSTEAMGNELKATIRRDALLRRDALPSAQRQQAAETIAARPFPLALKPGMIVSGFMPLKTEISPLPLMRKLSEAGARLALPAIDQ